MEDTVALRQFFSQYFGFPCQYQSTSAPYSPLSVSIHQSSILSPVSINPPVLHTLHCQYQSTSAPYSPLSVSIHQCSILSTVSINPPVLHTLPCQYQSTTAPYSFLQLHVFLPGQTEEVCEPSKKHCAFGYWALLGSKVPSTFRTVC